LTDSEVNLQFEALISRNADIPEARKAMALLEEGIVDEISVGFAWGTWEEKHKDEGFFIEHTKAALREFSVVTFGALGRDARVVTVAAERGMQEALAYKAKLARLRA
jgi:HK97 family phage prohead protease